MGGLCYRLTDVAGGHIEQKDMSGMNAVMYFPKYQTIALIIQGLEFPLNYAERMQNISIG